MVEGNSLSSNRKRELLDEYLVLLLNSPNLFKGNLETRTRKHVSAFEGLSPREMTFLRGYYGTCRSVIDDLTMYGDSRRVSFSKPGRRLHGINIPAGSFGICVIKNPLSYRRVTILPLKVEPYFKNLARRR